MSEVISKTYNTDSTFLSDVVVDRLTVTIPAGAANVPYIIKKGTVLGQIVETGKLVPYSKSSEGGAQIPFAIAIADLKNSTTSAVDVTEDVAVRCKINANKVILPEGETLDDVVEMFGLLRILMAKSGLYPVRNEQITNAYVG
jgi:hypothetical protein